MITIATWNSLKYDQISSVLKAGGIFVQQENIDLVEPQLNDMLQVSAYKTRQAFDIVWWPVVVDDSGIFFDAYPDFPWVFSKYIFQSLGINGLSRLFQDQPNKGAYFQCVLSYMDMTLDSPKQFIGKVSGKVCFEYLDQIVINPNWPYDAIFQAEEMNVVAQLDMNQFDTLHHRTKASDKLLEFLKNNQINGK
jgi:XTP/dITP diphosphohydrolase